MCSPVLPEKDLHVLLSSQLLKNNILFSAPESREGEEATHGNVQTAIFFGTKSIMAIPL